MSCATSRSATSSAASSLFRSLCSLIGTLAVVNIAVLWVLVKLLAGCITPQATPPSLALRDSAPISPEQRQTPTNDASSLVASSAGHSAVSAKQISAKRRPSLPLPAGISAGTATSRRFFSASHCSLAPLLLLPTPSSPFSSSSPPPSPPSSSSITQPASLAPSEPPPLSPSHSSASSPSESLPSSPLLLSSPTVNEVLAPQADDGGLFSKEALKAFCSPTEAPASSPPLSPVLPPSSLPEALPPSTSGTFPEKAPNASRPKGNTFVSSRKMKNEPVQEMEEGTSRRERRARQRHASALGKRKATRPVVGTIAAFK